MEFLNVLSREEMKNVKGGGGCRIFMPHAGGWSENCWATPRFADLYYEGHSYVTGYCCSSCGQGGFSNAQPC